MDRRSELPVGPGEYEHVDRPFSLLDMSNELEPFDQQGLQHLAPGHFAVTRVAPGGRDDVPSVRVDPAGTADDFEVGGTVGAPDDLPQALVFHVDSSAWQRAIAGERAAAHVAFDRGDFERRRWRLGAQ